MNGLEIITLHVLKTFKGQRTDAGCYHILRGKKSGQAIQDSALFHYKSWFGLFPKLEWTIFQQAMELLLANEYIEKIEHHSQTIVGGTDGQPQATKDYYQLTAKGRFISQEMEQVYHLSRRGFLIEPSGLSLAQVEAFWDRFQLVAQVLSYTLQQEKNFVPIVEHLGTQGWVKQFWRSITHKQEFASQLQAELQRLLHQLEDDILATLFVSRLAGYREPAQTWYQLEQQLQIPFALLQLFHLQIVGYVYQQISRNSSSCLHALCSIQDSRAQLTLSAQKSYELLQTGHSIEEIARIRQLKRSTIEDHIIEMAIHDPSFQLSSFLSDELCREILQVSRSLGTKKLSPIRKELGEGVSYLQIRLALIKEQGDQMLEGGGR